jgi:hypothetical protein
MCLEILTSDKGRQWTYYFDVHQGCDMRAIMCAIILTRFFPGIVLEPARRCGLIISPDPRNLLSCLCEKKMYVPVTRGIKKGEREKKIGEEHFRGASVDNNHCVNKVTLGLSVIPLCIRLISNNPTWPSLSCGRWGVQMTSPAHPPCRCHRRLSLLWLWRHLRLFFPLQQYQRHRL